MSKLRSLFLHALAFVILPLAYLGFRVAAKGNGLKRLRVGKLSVWGDSTFIELCRSSILRLKTLDPGLYQALTFTRWVWVFQDPRGIGDSPPRLFAINSAWTAWRADGVLARLVYIAFRILAISQARARGDEARKGQREVMMSTRSWLESRDFPNKLTDCFALAEGGV